MVRLGTDSCTAQDEREMAEALARLKDKRPALVNGLRELSRNQIRKELALRGLTHSDFPGGEVFMLQMPDELTEAPKRYAEKLGKALYYRHTDRILPTRGWVQTKVSTNAEFLSPRFFWGALEILAGIPLLTRSGHSLADQFVYRYGVAAKGQATGFAVRFRQSMVMTITVFEDREAAEQKLAERSAGGVA
jgi:hypothetical protein